MCRGVLKCVAVRYNELQRAVVCCSKLSVLQCVVITCCVMCQIWRRMCSVLQHVAVFGGVLQCAAVSCCIVS